VRKRRCFFDTITTSFPSSEQRPVHPFFSQEACSCSRAIVPHRTIILGTVFHSFLLVLVVGGADEVSLFSSSFNSSHSSYREIAQLLTLSNRRRLRLSVALPQFHHLEPSSESTSTTYELKSCFNLHLYPHNPPWTSWRTTKVPMLIR